MSSFIAVCLPYVIRKDKETGVWYALNRKYEPVGLGYVSDKSNERPVICHFNLADTVIKRLRTLCSEHLCEDCIYLYKTDPIRIKGGLIKYMEVLSILAKVKVNK